MRLIWVWFLALLAFPVVQSGSTLPWANGAPAAVSAQVPSLAVVTAAAAPAESLMAAPAPAAKRRGASWHGPLAGVIDHLDWVGDRKLKGSELAGNVVVVEFWAFQCVNCTRSLPAVRQLEARYRGSDVRLVGIHTPELDNERVPENVAKAVARDSIDWPVALDPEGEAWEAIGNRYWPCFYVLDRNGKVAYQHVGELHQGTPGWNELLKRIEAARAVTG